MRTVLEQMDKLRKQPPPESIPSKIIQDVEKIVAYCNEHYSDQLFYGGAALNRKIVLDSEIVDLLTPEALKVIFGSASGERFKISRNSGQGDVLLRDAIYHAFIDGPEAVKFMPNNDRQYGVEGYQAQKTAFEKTTKSLIKNIALASTAEEFDIQTDSIFSQIDLKHEVNIIRTAIDKVQSYDKSKLLSVPNYTSSQIENQTINGFEALMLLNGFKPNQSNRIDVSLESFCDTILKNPNALLHGDVIHLFYDRVHLEAAFSSDFSVDFSNGAFTLGDILEEMYSKVAENPKKYPVAFEQLSVRLSLVKKDLENRFPDDYKEASILSEGPAPGPSQKNDALEDAEYVLYAIAGLEHPNRPSNPQYSKKVHFKLNLQDQVIVSCPDGREYNLSCALKNANLEYFRLNQELHKPLFAALKSKKLIQYTDTISESLQDPNNPDDPILLSEQAAITAYSEESDIPNYQIMNALLRGNISDFTSDHKLLILSRIEKHFVNCMLAISGTNKNITRETLNADREKSVYYRVEKSPPENVLMGMTSAGQVTPYAGFVSYEEGRTHPDLKKNMITRIKGENTRQKSIKSVSSLEAENETLFSPLHLRYSNPRVNQSGYLTVDATIVQGISTEKNNNYFVDLAFSLAYDKLIDDRKSERVEIVRAVSYVDHIVSYFKNYTADERLKEFCTKLENNDIQLIKVLLILSKCYNKKIVSDETIHEFIKAHFKYLSQEEIKKYSELIKGKSDGLISHIISLSDELDKNSTKTIYSPESGFTENSDAAKKDYTTLKTIANESIFFSSENEKSKPSDREAIAHCIKNALYAQSFFNVISTSINTQHSGAVSVFLGKTSDLYKKVTNRRKLSVILNNKILSPYFDRVVQYIENNSIPINSFLTDLDFLSKNHPDYIDLEQYLSSDIPTDFYKRIAAFNILTKADIMSQDFFKKMNKKAGDATFDCIIKLNENNLLTTENLQRLLDGNNPNKLTSVIIALEAGSSCNDKNIALALRSEASEKFSKSLASLKKSNITLDESTTDFLTQSENPESYVNLFILLHNEDIFTDENVNRLKRARNPEIVANLLVFLKTSDIISHEEIERYDSECQSDNFGLKIFLALKEKKAIFDKETIKLIFSEKSISPAFRSLWQALNDTNMINSELIKILLNDSDYHLNELKKSVDILKDHNLLTKENIEKILEEKVNPKNIAAEIVLKQTPIEEAIIQEILLRHQLALVSVYLKKMNMLDSSTLKSLFSASHEALSVLRTLSEKNFKLDRSQLYFILSHSNIEYKIRNYIESLLQNKKLNWEILSFLIENKEIKEIDDLEISSVLNILAKYKLLNRNVLELFFNPKNGHTSKEQFLLLSSIIKCLDRGKSLDAETIFYLNEHKEKFTALLASGLRLNRHEFSLISQYSEKGDISKALVNLKIGFIFESGGILSVPKVSYPLADQFFSIVLKSKDPIEFSELIVLSYKNNFFMSEDPLSFDQKLLDHPSKAELLNLMLLFEKLTILSKENYDFLLNTTEIPKEIRSILEILEKNNITLKEDDLKMLIQSKSLYLTFSFLAILKDSNCLNESTASILLNSCLNENTLLQGVDMLLNSEDYSKNEKFMSYTLDFLQGSFSETVDKKLYADTIIKAMSPYASESTPKLSFDAFKQSCIEKLLSICNKNGCRTVIAEDSFDVFPAASKRNNFFTAQDSSLVSTLQSLFNTIQAAKNISDIEKILEEKINLPHFEIFCDYVIKNKSSVKSEAAPTPTPKF